MLAVLSFRRSRLETEYVGACVRLGHRQAYELLCAENLRYDAGLQLGRAKVEDRGQPNNASSLKTVAVPTRTATGDFLVDDKLVEVVKL